MSFAGKFYFTVTIDTEEDNWGEYDRPSYSVENVKRVPALQRVFEARGVRPTYLITYPVATDVAAVELLSNYVTQQRCEIGSHLHPWNTPPVTEARTPGNSFINNLHPRLQFEKIKALTDVIARNFGVRPTSYRSGRWGFSDAVARNLIRLGYTVDTSISPASDWTSDGGPDYAESSHEPLIYILDDENANRRGLLEVPATIAFVPSALRASGRIYWSIKRQLPLGRQIIGALSRARLLNRICVSPETHDALEMIRVARALLDRGTKVINMFFHSPSLLPGCSPFVKSEMDAVSFLARIDAFLAFAQASGLQPVTMSELATADIDATRVQVLLSRDDSVAA